jgi:hypothetical protein
MNGDTTELLMAARLKQSGYEVSIPVSGSCRYDLVAEKDGEFLRVQVKTARYSNGGIKFKCHSGNGVKRDRMGYTKEDIDIFMVFEPTEEQIFWIPVEETPTTSMKLRDPKTLKTNKSSNINFTTDYKFGE